jgi:hypothetical protein
LITAVRFIKSLPVNETTLASGGTFSGLPEKAERATKGATSFS